MEDIKAKASNLMDSVSEYAQTYYKYTLLNVADKATGVTAGLVSTLAVIFLGSFVLFFSGVALAIWLGSILDNRPAGYLIVAGIFLLLIILLVVFRKSIVFPTIRNWTVNKLYEKDDKDLQ
jgi:hypothetical protein